MADFRFLGYRLEVITGPMRSGKSGELIKRIERARIQFLPAIVFRPSVDTRTADGFVESRTGDKVDAIVVKDAREILEHADKAMVIGIDEAQFFDEEIVEVVQALLNMHKRVIVCGLNLGFRGLPLGSISQLIAMAEEHIEMYAVCCKCGSDHATRTQLTRPGKIVGGEHAFEPRCLNCFEPPLEDRVPVSPQGIKLFGAPEPIQRPLIYEGMDMDHVEPIRAELKRATKALAGVENAVAIYGSARTKEGSPQWQKAFLLGQKLARNGIAVITGGGPGIMEAANKGASSVGGVSVGLCIRLPREQKANPYLNLNVQFQYFRTRKMMYLQLSKAFIVLPGGYGTEDESGELLCLQKTGHYASMPVYFDKRFYEGKKQWMREVMLPEGCVSEDELAVMQLVDFDDESKMDEVVLSLAQLQRPIFDLADSPMNGANLVGVGAGVGV